MDSLFILDEKVLYKENVFIIKTIIYSDVLDTYVYGLVPENEPEQIERLIVREDFLVSYENR